MQFKKDPVKDPSNRKKQSNLHVNKHMNADAFIDIHCIGLVDELVSFALLITSRRHQQLHQTPYPLADARKDQHKNIGSKDYRLDHL